MGEEIQFIKSIKGRIDLITLKWNREIKLKHLRVKSLITRRIKQI